MYKDSMHRIKEGAKISLSVKDLLTTREKAKMQRHQMELKVNVTHQGKTHLEVATTQMR